MTATKAVADGKLTNEELGALSRRLDELKRRTNERTLPYPLVMDEVQRLIEGRGVPKWTEEDGIIYFSVTSSGTTGPEWIKRLGKKGFRVSDYAKELLQSSSFVPTDGITYRLAVIRATKFSDAGRVTNKIRAFAEGMKFQTPPAEIACLIREYFSDEELKQLGLWYIVAMHEPIIDSDGNPNLLHACRNDGGRWLDACWGGPDVRWGDRGAFACLAPQE